ncbi:hypothetical protein RUND412_003442 [Rhizina undulata]
MGRELQKKKNRSSNPKVTKRRNARVHKVRVLGNQIIAENWDKTQTLSQNYKRLGLTSRLNKPSGGTEKTLSSLSHPAPVDAAAAPKPLGPNEARIIRNEDGSIKEIVYGASHDEALNDYAEAEPAPVEAKTDIVRLLEAQAANVAEKRERTQSGREEEWIRVLVEKYGDDYEKMFWDRKLNPYQQSVGDLKRRVQKWEKKNKGKN